MTTCPDCQREVIPALYDGERIILDKTTQALGPSRFVLDGERSSDAELQTAIPIRADRSDYAHPLHETVCGKPLVG